MNPQGQPVQGQPNAMAAQQGSVGHPAAASQRSMYRPEMMRNLPILNDDEKVKYERGLRALWTTMEGNAEDSPQHQDAKKKIQDFTKMLMGKLQARRLQQQQQQLQQQQLQQAQQNQQAQKNQQPQQNVQQNQLPAQPQANAALAQPAVAEGTPAPQEATVKMEATGGNPSSKPAGTPGAVGEPAPAATAAPGPASAGPTVPQQQVLQPPQQPLQQAPQQPPQQPTNPIPEHILNHVRSMTFNAPPQIVEKGQDAALKWSNEMRNRYVRSLMQMEHAGHQMRKISSAIKERQDKGNPPSPEELKQLQIRRDHNQKLYQDAQQFVHSFRKAQELTKANAQNVAGATRPHQQNTMAASGQGLQPAQPVGQANVPQTGSHTLGPGGQNMQHQQAPALAEGARIQQAGAATQARGGMAGAPQHQPQAQPQIMAQQASVGTAQQPVPQPGVPSNQGHQGINTPGQANVAAPSASTPGQQNSARTQTPQTGLPGASGQALTHSAAVSRANQRINPQMPTNMPGQAGMGTPGPPGGPGHMGQGVMGSGAVSSNNSQQGHPHLHPVQPSQPPQTLHPKLPIPKQLHEKATQPPQPVNMTGGAGAGRPTYTGGNGIAGGVTGQPAMQKIPMYSHEAEGDHVLSKKKLDELVRQVCGGTAEGQEGNLLSPEVEESVLTMADSFVDNVLNAACRLAKERGSKVLEIRDIQLVLERTYNIRVPGYSSDELRTVRKVQPAPAWITKMSAIQAAKVTSGKTE
ncbi:hypothetical protein ACRALDRAFT_1083678 [Sodiomyces alcalophilus JCM 7366]|uniref:uncharacterized protein n=1 Tax=Sodiomyces alcalophilus JCM 7366 TaxID=591952 RepID=UPI0039B5430E